MREWEELPEVKWNEVAALVIFDTDKYLFDPDDLREYLEESGEPLEEIRFQICQTERPPEFEIKDFLYDHLGEWIDHLPPTAEIDRIVNDWIREHAPTMWTPINARPSLQSLKAAIE